MTGNEIDKGKVPKRNNANARAFMNIAAGAIPFVGGLLSAGAGYWSEQEQEKVNNVLRQWLQMLEDELREKGKTIAEVVSRLDMNDQNTKERVESPEYQAVQIRYSPDSRCLRAV